MRVIACPHQAGEDDDRRKRQSQSTTDCLPAPQAFHWQASFIRPKATSQCLKLKDDES
jgi:hypothetical protein